MRLVDEGTLDTVFECDRCRERLRYSEADRNDDGPTPGAYARAEEDHRDECPGPWGPPTIEIPRP